MEVLGPVNHTLFKSIYFFDPNGHRVELACDIATDQMNRALDKVKWDMLNEWAQTKKHPNTHNGYMMAQSRLMCD
ncbi:putative glyoxalase/bleomycin resistance protein/dioxygenase [Moraxella catarrhalis]|uniref:Glyoxalase/bleomycin resistance protein/dioxygenase n=1 Tax=Moraxella catarrhalis TaxID=480 RepID=A0ABY0BM52_MORCA|nr:putative glyoxalase/bleomycin resistance protein/dioxygenase [Moraxella catarrhalis]RUO17595.1 putative glyoxalase/bleomycin resistance protein/dioxygenase [Moraxella catarrhalis]